jgi:hypothetical protein
MNNPLQNRGEENRRTAAQKILGVADVIHELLKAILGIFGRRTTDKH